MRPTYCFLLIWCGLLRTQQSVAQLLPVTPGAGLRATYYDGRHFERPVLTRTDSVLDFNWTYGPPVAGRGGEHFVSPGPGVPAENFSVRWTGYLYAPVTGLYTLQILADDGMRVWVGGRRVLNSWRDQSATRTTTQVRLRAGRYYALRVEYYQVQWDTRAQLAWRPPTVPPTAWETLAEAVDLHDDAPETIPARYLYAALPTSARPLAPPVASVPAITATPPATTTLLALTPKSAPVLPKRAAVAVARAAAPAVALLKPVPLMTLPTSSDTLALPALTGLTKGEILTLPNLYFTRSTAALLPTSYPTLNALARTLRQQPTLHLEIAGHTDNVGAAHLNQRLSEQRAQVVRRYLVQQGIDSLRLSAVGYGGARPVADNRDPRQRPRNRRVEVVVQ